MTRTKAPATTTSLLLSRQRFLLQTIATVLLAATPIAVQAFAPPQQQQQRSRNLHQVSPLAAAGTTTVATNDDFRVAFQPLSVPMTDFDVNIPVACWYPISSSSQPQQGNSLQSATYPHKISVRKIGQMLVQWNIPKFVAKDYTLTPTEPYVTDGSQNNLPLPVEKGPVVILAHGFLGSRFDLSHLAEKLAAAGFTCLAPEYPESLAASYDPVDGLDRTLINDRLLDCMENEWNIRASAYGIVGHSLGCGTALQTGDSSWTRVLISGFARQRDGTVVPGNLLLMTSTNDGLAKNKLAEPGAIPSDFDMLDSTEHHDSGSSSNERIPRRAAIVYEGPEAPNHISFLSAGTNDAMVDFLSPLLPVAQVLGIPVLDFDRYKESRDADATAKKVHPLIIKYLCQEMKVPQTVLAA